MDFPKLLILAATLISIDCAYADGMCDMLNDPTFPAYARKSLEMRCNPEKSFAKTAYIKDGKGYVVSAGKIVETVEGVGADWTISYVEGQFYFNPPRTAATAQGSSGATR